MGRVERREWVWVLVMAGLVTVVSSVPYTVGYLAQTPGERFSGALLDRVDYHSYLSRMWQGYRGEWQFRLLFTPEPHTGAYFQPLYIALGHLARLTGLGIPLVYQIARGMFGFLMLLAIYRFIAEFVPSVRPRRLAFWLATTASGLGWLSELFLPTPSGGVSPMDFWLLDGFTYLLVLVSPHFCAAIGLLLAIFVLLLRRPAGPSLAEGALTVLASLVLGLIHPYTLLIADLVPALYWIVEGVRARRVVWRGLMVMIVMGVAQLPLLVYDLWVFRSRPIFAGWSAQNVTLSPPPRIYLLGYGVLLVLGIRGALVWARRGAQRLAFPVVWIGLVAVLIHLPWNLQRRFLEGVQVPLGLLAGVGLAEGFLSQRGGKGQSRWRGSIQVAIVALAAVSNLYLTAGLTLAAATRSPALFWPVSLLDGVDWLGANASWDETVLAGFETGNLIPARIGQRVVLGHWMETVDYVAKREAVARFFAADTPDEERLDLLSGWNVTWVFYGPAERSLGDFDPGTAPWLLPAWQTAEVAVYRVALEEAP